MRVLYQTNLPSPYTIAFFNELGKECELTVLYERRTASDRDAKWVSEEAQTYTEVYLEGRAIGTENSFCPSIVKYLKQSFDRIVIGDYGTYTGMWAIWYMRRHKIPYILSTDGGFANYSESSIKKKLKTYLIGGASKWLSSGGLSDEYLIHYGAKKDRIYRYPFTSLDEKDICDTVLSAEEKSKLRDSLGLKGDVVIIGVGQIIPRKGWDILVSAMKELDTDRDVQTYVVGGKESKLTELVGELPANVHVIPFMSKKELFEYYRASDIFVLPTREDIWGLVVNEAMACGLPIITTDRCNAGIELIKDGENGCIVPTDNRDALCGAMLKLIASDNLQEISNNNLKKIREYTYLGMVKAYLAALK